MNCTNSCCVFYSAVAHIGHSVFFSQQYLYGTMTRHLSYNDFINKELILFSNSDNERSIPSLVDGVFIFSLAFTFSCSTALVTNYSKTNVFHDDDDK